MKIVAIIQARMGSTRLPGKVMKTVNGKTLLEYQLERVKRSKLIDEVIIATTNKEKEQPIIDLCKKLSIRYYSGSENDVLSRYYEAAKKYDGDIIVRLTSDCPLIDPEVIDIVIKQYLDNSSYDYASNTLVRTYPRGMDTSVFSFEILEKMNQAAKADSEREHVTLYITKRSEQYNLLNVKNNKDYSRFRLTVDTVEDFELVSKIIQNLYPQNSLFTLNDIIVFLNQNPKLIKINEHIEQKKV
ncbi:cytidylyltransferase domain-containing protein [Metabacillus fastidiosus]|uniref:cytidylyltransferase domain-containing protein n=1 Tax=Metabacillus fastidiosus TaxID=1458 RepID=UPI003D2DAB55